MAPRDDLEVRDVVSDDPSLTPEANRLLTEEARRAVGSDKVRVPRGTPRHSREQHGGRSGMATEFAANRVLIAITFFALLVVGAIVALATAQWWAVILAALVHAIGTFVVLGILAGAARQTEHVGPNVAARLAEEGVPDPDAQLSDLVEEYAGAQGDHGVADMVTTGANEQTADPSTDPAAATAQQRTAMTPAGTPSARAGTDSAVDRGLVKGVPIGLLVVAIVSGLLAPFIEVRLLAIPAVVLPAVLAWFLLQQRMDGRREELAGQAGETTDTAPGSGARAVAGVAGAVLAVVAFVAVMGWLGGLI
jgi:hypothetical protein